MNAATARRLGALEPKALGEQRRRQEAACEALTRHDDARARGAGPRRLGSPPPRPRGAQPAGETFAARLLRTDPPALVRAVFMLLAWRLEDGRPLSLPGYVAEVYLADPDALPGDACDACGYCLPLQGRLLPSGEIERTGGTYDGPCPVCTGHRRGQEGTPA